MNDAGVAAAGVDFTRDRRTIPAKAADLLYLAAAPTFALMAILTGVDGDGHADVLCPAAGASFLGGMMPMYLLMSAFHSAPWLKRFGKRKNAVGQS